MITAVVAAIAITQREARREKAAKEAEEAEARKKSILVIGAGIAGLFAALLCRAQGFPVTVVDKKTQDELLEPEDGIVWLAVNALRVLEKVDEKLIPELRKNAAQTEVSIVPNIIPIMSDECRRFTTAATNPANQSPKPR